MSDNPPAKAPHPCGPCRSHRSHGGVRGADLSRRSSLAEGRFGRMFRTLPAAQFSDAALAALADRMTAPFEPAQTPEDANPRDDEENTGISAGYTYLGQFLDHDLTFDPASSLQKKNDPDALTDFRTPRFDLDSVYGRGPDDQPYLYADDGLHMLLGQPLTPTDFDPRPRDLPRNTPRPGEPARALIGDPRNDENTIVSQLQSAMLRFHNRVVDYLAATLGRAPSFAEVQQQVQWHYQWVIVHDFLPTIIGTGALAAILPPPTVDAQGGTEFAPNLKFFKWKEQPFMPIEFSAAAYRFGHSMVRPLYRLNALHPADPPGRLFIFPQPDGDPDGGLTGFRAFSPDRAVDWTLFFDFGIAGQPAFGPGRVQPAYKIDTSLVNPLGFLPQSIGPGVHALAARNLLRGRSMSLPSGQDVARAMGVPAISDGDLRVGKANEDDFGTNPRLVDLAPEFTDNAPLWYYVLAEAMQPFVDNDTPLRLGPVGGRIVGEVFVGLLWGDSHSYLRQNPGWSPIAAFTRDGQFGMADLVTQAIQAA